MELRHLRYFIAVAEEGSLTLAAERRLHTSQPSLSRQIRDLEYEVGAQLMTRSARGIELTDAELWISRRPREAPEPTDLHRTLIQESRKGEQARAQREAEQLAARERAQGRARVALSCLFVLAILKAHSLLAKDAKTSRGFIGRRQGRTL